MHTTRIKLKDGSVYEGTIWDFRPRHGYLTLVEHDRSFHFEDMVSCLTENQRIGIKTLGDQDELERARKNGWTDTRKKEDSSWQKDKKKAP